MAEQDQKTPQTADNPNRAGQGPNKGNLRAGDIEWVTPPPNMEQRDGRLVPKGATEKKLSAGQRRDLAGRIKAKLRLAATKKPE